MTIPSSLPIPHPLPDEGPRAFEALPAVPPGCFTVNIRDGAHWPHLRQGEVAVVDATSRDITFGELYAVRQGNGPTLWQVNRCAIGKIVGYDGPIVMLSPLNKPRRLPDGSLDWTGPLHMSDGPLRLDTLQPRILGRVVGLLDEQPFDPAEGDRTPPVAVTVPQPAKGDEIKWRYLAFLTAERDHLARELTAVSGSRVFCFEDGAVNRFFAPFKNDQGRHGRPGNRAQAMLETAGVSTLADPNWLGFVR